MRPAVPGAERDAAVLQKLRGKSHTGAAAGCTAPQPKPRALRALVEVDSNGLSGGDAAHPVGGSAAARTKEKAQAALLAMARQRAIEAAAAEEYERTLAEETTRAAVEYEQALAEERARLAAVAEGKQRAQDAATALAGEIAQRARLAPPKEGSPAADGRAADRRQPMPLWEAHVVQQLRAAMASERTLYGARVCSPADFFTAVDRDGSGAVDAAEFRTALERLDVALTAEQLQLLFETMDVDCSGQLSYSELLAELGGGGQGLAGMRPVAGTVGSSTQLGVGGANQEGPADTRAVAAPAASTPVPSRPARPAATTGGRMLSETGSNNTSPVSTAASSSSQPAGQLRRREHKHPRTLHLKQSAISFAATVVGESSVGHIRWPPTHPHDDPLAPLAPDPPISKQHLTALVVLVLFAPASATVSSTTSECGCF